LRAINVNVHRPLSFRLNELNITTLDECESFIEQESCKADVYGKVCVELFPLCWQFIINIYLILSIIFFVILSFMVSFFAYFLAPRGVCGVFEFSAGCQNEEQILSQYSSIEYRQYSVSQKCRFGCFL
jgi:hypothetical protein